MMNENETTETVIDTTTESEGAELAGEGKAELSREAAKYRTRLREVEAERDRLASASSALRDEVLNFHLRDYHEVTTVPTTGNRAVTPEGQVKPVTVSCSRSGTRQRFPTIARADWPLRWHIEAVDSGRLAVAV